MIFCGKCVCKHAEMDFSTIDEEGTVPCRYDRTQRTDQISWYFPCMPNSNGGYWDYASAPEEAIALWRALPLL
jgi:hypothetical protein